MKNRKKAYLTLADGTVYEGYSFGAEGTCTGELVFTTGMCGYIETLTDPSYAGQIVMQTFPLIGNYGIIPADFEGSSFVRGYVVREYCDTPSNFRCEMTLDQFLKENSILGIYGIDTRDINRKISEYCVMNAVISTAPEKNTGGIEAYRVSETIVSDVSTEEVSSACSGEARYKVVLIDYGAKNNIRNELVKRGCEVTTVPYDTPAEKILDMDPDGIMLSNGPGDPADNTYSIEQISKVMGKKPVFGICLGHQMAALAAGGKTYKLKYGHRGANQPCTDVETGRTYITTQNHGYAVDMDALPPSGKVRFVNANDGTCEGMDYPSLKCFTVQFHPEACAGPKDTSFLFDRFIRMMEED